MTRTLTSEPSPAVISVGLDRGVRHVPDLLEQVAKLVGRLVPARAVGDLEQGDLTRRRRRAGPVRLRLVRDEGRGGVDVLAGPAAIEVHEQRVAPRRHVVGRLERDPRLLVEERLDPVLLALGEGDPVGPRRQDGRRRRIAVRVEGPEGERCGQALDVHVHPLQPPDEPLQLVGAVGVVAQEVVADRDVRDGLVEVVALLVHVVGLELAGEALLVGLDVGVAPGLDDRGAGRRAREERRPDRGELLVLALDDRVPGLLLEGHPGGVEAGGRDGVAEDHREEVVRRPVEVADPLRLEGVDDGRAVQLVDPVVRRVRDLVIFGIGVGREEVVRQPELVGIDEQHRRVPPNDVELAVGLRLGPGEPVTVHVEAVQVASLADLAAIGVLGRQDDEDRRVEHALDHAIGPGGQLVQGVQRRIGAALLATVDVACDPQDGRRRSEGGIDRGLVGERVAQDPEVRRDRGQRVRGHPVRAADDGVADRLPVDRRRGFGGDDPRAVLVDGREVRVDLVDVVGRVGRIASIDEELLRTEVEAEDGGRGAHILVIRRRGRRIARGQDRRWRGSGRDEQGQAESDGERSTHWTPP